MKPDNATAEDGLPDACAASATGIVACLRMLVAEAFSLDLTQTAQALAAAIDTCVCERAEAKTRPAAQPRH